MGARHRARASSIHIIKVTLCDGSTCGHVTVLAVHVDGSTTRHISQPDSKVLDAGWALIMYLRAAHDFATALLHFLEETSKVPETRLGCCLVWGKDGHLVHGWYLHLFGGALPPDHLVFTQYTT